MLITVPCNTFPQPALLLVNTTACLPGLGRAPVPQESHTQCSQAGSQTSTAKPHFPGAMIVDVAFQK